MKNIFIILALGFLLAISIKQGQEIQKLEDNYNDLSIQIQEQALLDQIGKQLISSKLNVRDFNQ
jgi:hypothetical protein